MNNGLLVTILTVVFNGEKTIAKTIESVLNQNYSRVEYLVIDGASSDRTVEIAQSYQDAFNSKAGWTFKVISEPDKGMYHALNKGVSLANGELIGNINADDWYEPDAIEKMVALYHHEQYEIAWGNLKVHKRTGAMIKRAKAGKVVWVTTGFCHPSMFAKKTTLDRFPYACENMYDDFDMVTRARLAGCKIITTNDLIANFVYGGMSNTKSLKDTLYRIKIKYHGYRKHGMSRLYWFYCVAIESAKYVLG